MDEDKSLLSMGVDHDPPLARGGAAYAPYACATVPASGHEESEEVAIEPAPLLETQPLLPSPSPLDLARTDADIPADILDAFPRETTVARVPGLRLPPALGHMTSRQPMETASTSSTPTAPPATFDITPSHIRWHHTYPHQNHHPIPCWPFTSLGRRVACPAALRVTDQQDRDVPAAHHACSLWWLSWVFAGGDPASLANDSNDYALLAQRFHWQLPPVGCQRPWSPSDFASSKLRPPHDDAHRMQAWLHTLFARVGATALLARVCESGRHGFAASLILVTLLLILLPTLCVALLTAAVPYGKPLDCTFGARALWILVVNPLWHAIVVWILLTLLVASLDYYRPYRPFWVFLPVTLGVYMLQVLYYGAIIYFVGSFPFNGAVAVLLSAVFVAANLPRMRRLLVGPVSPASKANADDLDLTASLLDPNNTGAANSDSEDKDESTIDEEDMEALSPRQLHAPPAVLLRRWRAYMHFLTVFVIGTLVYAAYTLGFKLGSSSKVKVGLALALFFSEVALRKFAQHLCRPLHRDLNFLFSGYWVYSMHAFYLVFSAPDIRLGKVDNLHSLVPVLLAVGSHPLLSAFRAFLHQTEFWMRFRCWIKKIPKPVFVCARIDPMALPIKEDMDYDDRGITNSHPPYRRAKATFDFYNMLGTLTAYGVYLAGSWALKYGKNGEQGNFPFGNEADVTSRHRGGGFSDRDFRSSLYFALCVWVLTLAVMLFWARFLRLYFHDVHRCLQHVHHTLISQPQLLLYTVLILLLNSLMVLYMLALPTRIWYFDIDMASIGSDTICSH